MAGRADARPPPWQLAQLPATTPWWSKVATGSQPAARWQLSQAATVGVCPEGLPLAALPLWQLRQLPGVTPWWLKRAPLKLCVPWQFSQACALVTCRAGITTLPRARRWPL
ncbi:MAG: hypothetical protein U1F56_16370 [Rubrivivax sp.]